MTDEARRRMIAHLRKDPLLITFNSDGEPYRKSWPQRMNLLNCQQLAEQMQKSPGFVTAMRRAGYVMLVEAACRTTIEHAVEWLRAFPEFCATDYLSKGWKRLPKLRPEPPCRRVAVAGKSR